MAKVVDGKKRGRPGRWLVDFRDQDGVRRWKTYATREAALIGQAELEKQIERRTYLPPNVRPTVAQRSEAWLATKQDRRPATIAGWETHIYQHIVPRIGEIRVDLFEVSDGERFRDAMAIGAPIDGHERKALAPITVNKVLTTAESIFNRVMRDYPDLVRRNPIALVERLRPRMSDELDALSGEATDDDPLAVDPSDVPTPEDVGALIEHASPGIFRTYFLVAALTGARSEELLALQWRHVDLDGKVTSKAEGPKIMIRRAVSWARTRRDTNRPNGPRYFPPKTKTSRRDIPMPPPLVDALRAWRRDCPTPLPLGLVFPKPDGTAMHRKLLYDQGLTPALAAAKLSHFTIHSLRHSFASSLAIEGRPPMEIAGYLGHSSADVTLRVYAHWFPKQRTGAMESHAHRVLGGGAATAPGSTKR